MPLAALSLVPATLVPSQTLPDLGDASQAVISPAQERKLGEATMRQVHASGAYLDDPEVEGVACHFTVPEKGGYKGQKVNLIIYDTEGKPPKAVENITRLITRDKCFALLGATASGETLAVIDIAQENEVPLVVPVSTAAEVIQRHANKPKMYIYRVSLVDTYQISLILDYIQAKGFKKLAGVKAGETVVFSFIVYRSRAHRDKVNAAVMKDPRMSDFAMKESMPFDMKRFATGGFDVLVAW